MVPKTYPLPTHSVWVGRLTPDQLGNTDEYDQYLVVPRDEITGPHWRIVTVIPNFGSPCWITPRRWGPLPRSNALELVVPRLQDLNRPMLETLTRVKRAPYHLYNFALRASGGHSREDRVAVLT